jgi:hypothetical protein
MAGIPLASKLGKHLIFMSYTSRTPIRVATKALRILGTGTSVKHTFLQVDFSVSLDLPLLISL